MKYNSSTLEKYSEAISTTEKQQCENAIDMVKDALIDFGYKIKTNRSNYSDDGYAYFYELRDSQYSTITVLLQGSYANNTNIKRYSDVDVSIVYNSFIPISLESGFGKFKDNIYKALKAKFGNDARRKNKSIRIEGNSYRKSIDVVPAFTITSKIEDGIQFLTDENEKIINYPLKQIKNENLKNRNTGYKFKKYARILKNIKKDMEESKILSAKNIGSFQLESLLWNVDNEKITRYTTLGYGVEEIITYLVKYKHSISSYYESNRIKKLCSGYMDKYYLEQFIDDLESFFNYEA